MQQRGILGDHPDLAAQALLRHFSNILTVNQDTTAVEVVQAQQQVHQGGFTRTGRPNQANFFSGFDGQVQAINDLTAAAIVKTDSVETNLALRHL